MGMHPRRRDGGRDQRFLGEPDRPLQGASLCQFVDGFPMTVTGKVQIFLMRQQMIDELGLSLQETA
jgi:hypothetical protein